MTETSLRLDQTQRSNALKQLLKSVVTTTILCSPAWLF